MAQKFKKLTKAKQAAIVKRLQAARWSIPGWSRQNGFKPDTVKKVLYFDYGLGDSAKVVEIIGKLKAQKFHK